MQIFDETTLKIRVGRLIASKRKSLNISQEALAEKLDIHVRTIGKIEHGHSFPTPDSLCKLSVIFDMPIKSFFEIEDPIKFDEKNLNILVDKLKTGNSNDIDLYLNIINLIDARLQK